MKKILLIVILLAEFVYSQQGYSFYNPIKADVVYNYSNGGTIVLLGNSITAGAAGYTAPATYQSPKYFYFANALLGSPFTILANAGVGGNTTTQMIARLQTDVINLHPKYCLVEAGINDLNSSGTSTSIMANLETIYKTLQQNNIIPIATTVMPSNSFTGTEINELYNTNAKLKSYCRDKGIILIDLTSKYGSDSTSRPRTGYTDDGTHPNVKGGMLQGYYMYLQLKEFFKATDAMTSSSADSNNVLANSSQYGVDGTKSGAGVSGDYSSSFKITAATGTVVGSKTLRSDSLGYWQDIDISHTSNVTINYWQDIYIRNGGKLSVGDTVYFQVEAKINAPTTAVKDLYIECEMRNSGGTALAFNRDMYTASADSAWSVIPSTTFIMKTPYFVIPATTDRVLCWLKCTATAANISVGRYELRKKI